MSRRSAQNSTALPTFTCAQTCASDEKKNLFGSVPREAAVCDALRDNASERRESMIVQVPVSGMLMPVWLLRGAVAGRARLGDDAPRYLPGRIRIPLDEAHGEDGPVGSARELPLEALIADDGRPRLSLREEDARRSSVASVLTTIVEGRRFAGSESAGEPPSALLPLSSVCDMAKLARVTRQVASKRVGSVRLPT